MSTILSEKKPLLIAAVVALGIIGALLVYGILITPARQPYRDALAQYENTNIALDRTNISLNTSTASDDDFAKSVSSVKTALASLEKENEALARQGVLKDGEGKALYEKYDERIKQYITYNTDVLASIEKFRAPLRDCSTVMTDVIESAEGATATRDCAAKMAGIGELPDADYAELATRFEESYTALADVFDQMNALADPEGADAARQAELEKRHTEILEGFKQASTDFSTNVRDHRGEILSTDAAQKLKNYLQDKSRVFA